jgi:CRP/FNR family transcriptional regulator, cyclic AMP receptor protein
VVLSGENSLLPRVSQNEHTSLRSTGNIAAWESLRREAAFVAGMSVMDSQEIVRLYRAAWPTTSFLAGLDMPILLDFLIAGDLVRFCKGQALIREGDQVDDTFLLLEASVKVTAQLDAGGKALLAIRVGGDIVGEITAMDGGSRTATVSACGHQPVTAVRLLRNDLHGLLDRYPSAAVSLASAVSRKLRAASRRHVDMINCTAKVGMARVVLGLAEDYGYPADRGGTLIGVNLTQIELGTLVGVGETTAQRALRDLRKDGLLASYGRRLLIPSVAKLRSVAWSS